MFQTKRQVSEIASDKAFEYVDTFKTSSKLQNISKHFSNLLLKN